MLTMLKLKAASSSRLACPIGIFTHVKRARRTHATTSRVRASTATKHESSARGGERVLRYPDGRVRCIRYPEINAESEIQPDQFDVTISYEEDWDSDHWDDIDWAWDVTSQWDRPNFITPSASEHALRQADTLKSTKVQILKLQLLEYAALLSCIVTTPAAPH